MCRSPLAAHLLPLPPLLPDIRTTSRITRWSKTMWNVFLTGATGFLGGELAVALSKTECADKVVCLIHAGANTSFLKQKYPVLEETNVRGTHRIANWASQLSSLVAFAHIGTATIAGAGENVMGRTLLEDEPDFSARHLVGYTQSKLLAEVTALATIPRNKLTVIRPSILLGDTRRVVPPSRMEGRITVSLL